MTDETLLSELANELLDSLVMQYKAGIDGGGGSKTLPGHPAQQSREAYEELARVGFLKETEPGVPGSEHGRWVLTPKGKQLASCALDPRP
jgi:hypothetical protein